MWPWKPKLFKPLLKTKELNRLQHALQDLTPPCHSSYLKMTIKSPAISHDSTTLTVTISNSFHRYSLMLLSGLPYTEVHKKGIWPWVSHICICTNWGWTFSTSNLISSFHKIQIPPANPLASTLKELLNLNFAMAESALLPLFLFQKEQQDLAENFFCTH